MWVHGRRQATSKLLLQFLFWLFLHFFMPLVFDEPPVWSPVSCKYWLNEFTFLGLDWTIGFHYKHSVIICNVPGSGQFAAHLAAVACFFMRSASPPTTTDHNQAFAAGALQYRPLSVNLQQYVYIYSPSIVRFSKEFKLTEFHLRKRYERKPVYWPHDIPSW